MKKLTFLLNAFLFLSALCVSGTANANSCFLATEDGSSSNCDNGTAQVGLPEYSSNTISKKGTSGLCNNVTAFSDKGQALQYAASHDYDDGVSQPTGSSCWVPKCKDSSDTGNSTSSKCKSLVNDKCWHKCDLCRFNVILNEHYPYADDDKLKACEIIGERNIDAAPYILSGNHVNRNYKISGLSNLEPKDSWNTDVWTCDLDTVKDVLDTCISKVQNTRIVRGYNVATKVSDINYLCVKSNKVLLSKSDDDQFYANFVKTYGCPLSAIKCNASSSEKYSKYYNSASDCETAVANNNPCSVVKNYTGYGDPECWHGSRRCSDFGHDDYIVGNYNALTCPTGSNTKKEYYKNKTTGKTVVLEDRECGACECLENYYRVSLCNSTIYEITRNYFKSKTRCNNRGYDLEVVPDGKNSCVACPYSAKFWKCD